MSNNKYQTNRVKISEKLGKTSFFPKKSVHTQNSLKIHQSPLFNPKWYKVFSLGLFAFLCAYTVASTLTPVQVSDASTVVISNNTSDFFIQITSADTLPLTVTAKPTGQLSYRADTINVTTNSDNGYKLYVSTSSNDNNIYQGGDASTASQGYFQPTSGTLSSPTALSQNTWGFALNKSQNTSFSSAFANVSEYVNETGAPTTSSTWAAVPTYANSETAKISEYSTSNYPDGTNLDIYYGVNASTTLPTGNYATEVTYTAFSEGVNVFPTMQDFTAAQCDAMGTNTSINLSDARDDKYYRVTKMADGHCWMTDNLALDGTDKAGNVRVLTPADSNVTTNRPLAANIENGTASAYDVVQIYSGNANDVTSECNPSYSDCIVNTTTKYGNLYNWNAATAGVGKQATTGTAIESVCPKGWRLPDITGDFSYANLMGKYSLPTGNVTDHTAVQTAQQAPLNFALAGSYANSSVGQARAAIYWSRKSGDNNPDGAYRLAFISQSGAFHMQSSASKYEGYSVRCVFGGQSDEIMQNFTATMCNNLAESTATVDNRKTMIDSRDGKFYTISKLADGNCWMTSNLALDGMDGLGAVRTLTTADSNVTTDRTLATNITNGTTSEFDVVQIYAGNANDVTVTCLNSYPDCITSDIKYGNLYNWNAATASVGKQTTATDVAESVCPKGWQLPNSVGAKSFGGLAVAYGFSGGVGHDTVKAIQKAPLNFSLTGVYGNASSDQAYRAFYWSRTVYSAGSNYAYNLNFNSETGNFAPQDNIYKFLGSSVRCVFGG